jgi:hypothetical protein
VTVERNRFMAVIQKLAPDAVAELRDAALMHFGALTPEMRRMPYVWNNRTVGGWAALRADHARHPTAASSALIESCETWASRYHVAVEWILDRMLASLHRWHGQGGDDQLHGGLGLSGGLATPPPLNFNVLCHPWVPELERRTRYEQRVRAVAEQLLKAYLDPIEAAARLDPGLKPVPVHRQAGKAAVRAQEWLVQWQVLGWTWRSIAETAGIGKTKRKKTSRGLRETRSGIATVKGAAIAAAEFIGLPPRHGRQGRRTK